MSSNGQGVPQVPKVCEPWRMCLVLFCQCPSYFSRGLLLPSLSDLLAWCAKCRIDVWSCRRCQQILFARHLCQAARDQGTVRPQQPVPGPQLRPPQSQEASLGQWNPELSCFCNARSNGAGRCNGSSNEQCRGPIPHAGLVPCAKCPKCNPRNFAASREVWSWSILMKGS